MTREPRPFRFELTAPEADEIRNAVGSGGQQTLHRRLVEELDANDGTITFDDQELGTLIRYMTQYGSGGFQDRLHAAFDRSLKGLLGW
jgi:hypothetical protein